ncbi:hypothetical protein TNCV_1644161 [Trichonephila clavipes]|nr:hypothetical protein TNCV_1644161 [Trichonephila clavipes]
MTILWDQFLPLTNIDRIDEEMVPPVHDILKLSSAAHVGTQRPVRNWSLKNEFRFYRKCEDTKDINHRHGTGKEVNILQSPAPVVSSTTAHQTFGPIDLMSTYSVCTQRLFGGIGHRTHASGKESDALTTRLPTALIPKVKRVFTN